jgi:hypothetical protein
MPVMERTKIKLPPEALNLPTVEYPPEVIARWDKQFEIAKLKIATGELVPQTVEELAAELGINLDDEDDDYYDEN